MEQSFLKQMSGFLRDKKNRKRYIAVFLCLALVVSLTTFVSLTMSGNAQNHMVKVLDCKYEAHKHTADCYDKEHPDQLICGYADYAVHIHNDDCYDASGVLVCQLPQIEPHTHDETCYTEEKTLTCELPESEGHVHTEACYTTEQGELTCTVEEHTHSEECYDENGEVICGKEEHTHNEACYEQIQTLTCEIPEGEGAHTHTDDCYVTEKKLTCGKLELHTHTEECYQHDENGKLVLANDAELVLDDEGNPVFDEEHQPIVICGIPVLEEHVHGADCFKTVELTDEEVDGFDTPETSEAPAESESCYDAEGNLICTKEEHTHTEECYDEAAAEIVCGKEEHTHTPPAPAEAESCYDAEGNLICTKEEHTHTEECYDEDGTLICEKEEHTHTAPAEAPAEAESCYDAEGNLICTKEEHTHTEECYDEDGALICEKEEHTHTGAGESNEPEELTKTYQDSGVVITATYTEAANIPEEAELIAKAVTSETDPELYAQRMEEALQHVTLPEDAETPNMLLYNIGFYVNGEEVEPAAPVTITVQLLNAEGFAVGAPITVVHFADDGTEVLDGTALNANSETTFTTDGFSPFALLSTTGNDFGIMPIAVPESAKDLTPYITGADDQGVTYDPLTKKWSSRFSMDFTIKQEGFAGGNLDFEYVFPDGIEIPESLLSEPGTPFENYPHEDDQHRFTYSFTEEEDGYHLHIHFKETHDSDVDCTLEYNATGSRDNNDDDLEFEFNDDAKIEVPAKEIKRKTDISVRKEGHYDPATDTLTYTVYVESQYGTNGEINLSDFLQWDGTPPTGLQFGELKDVTVQKQSFNYALPWDTNQVKDIDDPYKPDLTKNGDGSTTAGFEMTLPGLEPEDGLATRYKITYTYTLDGEVGAQSAQAKNSVEAEIPSDSDGASSHVDVKKDMLRKSAYQDKDKIVWTLYVNSAGEDITGYTLSDDFFEKYGFDSLDDFVINPSEGVLFTTKDEKPCLEFTEINGKRNKTKYTITYRTPVPKDDDGNVIEKPVNNKADFADPDGPHYETEQKFTPSKPGSSGDDDYKPKAEKTYENVYKVDGGRIVEWHVDVKVPGDGFPAGALFEDEIGTSDTRHYMTLDQLRDLIATFGRMGILQYTDDWKFVCRREGDHGNNTEQHSFNPNTWVAKDGHPMNDDCMIGYFSFRFKENVSYDVFENGHFTFTYKTFVTLEAVEEGGHLYLQNTFNNATAQDNLWYDQVEKTNGEGEHDADVKVNPDGTLTWQVKINVNEQDGHEQIVVTDNLPVSEKDKVTLQSVEYTETQGGSIIRSGTDIPTESTDTHKFGSLDGVTWQYDPETGESIITIEPASGEKIPNGTEIVLTYTCKIDDEKYLESLKGGPGVTVEKRRYENTVEVRFDGKPTSDSDKQTVVGRSDGFDENEVVNKGGEYNEGTAKIEYTVALNPTGQQFLEAEGGMINFTDELTYTTGQNLNPAWNIKEAIWNALRNGILKTTPALPDLSEYTRYGADVFAVYYDPYYTLDTDSVKLFYAKEDETGALVKDETGALVPGEEVPNWAWKLDETYDKDGYHKFISAQVPDGTPLVVQYAYTVDLRFYIKFASYVDPPITGEYELRYSDLNFYDIDDFPVEVSNSATLYGKYTDDEDKKIDWKQAATSASSAVNGAVVYKVEALHYATHLKDAVFDLYDEKGDVKVPDITTDTNGKIVVSCEVAKEKDKVSLTYKLTGKDNETKDFEAKAGEYYFLKEKTPPSGYEIPDKETIVVLWYPESENQESPSTEDILKQLPTGGGDGHEYEVKLIRMDNPTTTWVENEPSPNPGYTLPETGGDTTHMYMLGGAMLLLLAAALAYKAKISGRGVFRG